MRKLAGIVGLLGALFSIACAVAVIADLGSAHDAAHTVGGQLAGLIIFIGVTVGCGLLARWGFQGPATPVLTREAREQVVLDYVAKAGGRATAVEVATRCRIAVEDSKQALDALASSGEAELVVTDDGTLVYEVRGLLTDEQKAKATGPLG